MFRNVFTFMLKSKAVFPKEFLTWKRGHWSQETFLKISIELIIATQRKEVILKAWAKGNFQSMS